MRSPLEADAVVDGALSRKSSHQLWCKSVMAVQEKCDEKGGGALNSVFSPRRHGDTEKTLKL